MIEAAAAAAFFLDVILAAAVVRQWKLLKSFRKRRGDRDAFIHRVEKIQRDCMLEEQREKLEKSFSKQARALNRFAMVKKWRRMMHFTRLSRKDVKEWSWYCSRQAELALEKVVEETKELSKAVKEHDFAAMVDAAADVAYSVEAFPVIFNYDGNAAFLAVHESNLTKTPFIQCFNINGKGADYKRPDFSKVRGFQK